MVRTSTPSQSWFRKDGSKYKPKSKWTHVNAANQSSKEWDIRVDVGDTFTTDYLITCLSAHITRIAYAMMSTVEGPDPHESAAWKARGGPRSENDHVHIALVLDQALPREQVVRLVLNRPSEEVPKGALYCVPRRATFSYGGWLAHHTKDFTKMSPTETNCLWEYGILPCEDLIQVDDITLTRWVNTITKYATPYWRNKLKHYVEHRELRAGDREEQEQQAVHPDFNIIEIIPYDKLMGGGV